MGYYLNIHFPPGTANGGALLDLACEKAGFYRDEDHVYTTRRWYIPHGTLDIYDEESEERPGSWANIRLSWGAAPRMFTRFLVVLSHLGEEYGFRIYDGQIHKYITDDTIAEAVRKLRYGLAMVGSMWGTVRKTKQKPTFPGDPDFMNPPGYTDPVLSFFPVFGKSIPANADDIREKLNDAIAFNLLDFDTIAELQFPEQIKRFLADRQITTQERLLMATEKELRPVSPTQSADGDYIPSIRKVARDLLGIWEPGDFDGAFFTIKTGE